MTHAALQTLYISQHRWLHGWLRHRLGNDGDAADLMQDTFMRVLTSIHLPAVLEREPRALLTHIAKGLVIDRWRHQEVERAYAQAVAHLPPEHAPSPEDRLLVIETLQRIDAMLAELPARTREVFLLAQLEALTLREIAERMGMPVITVRRHVHKAWVACMALA